MKISTFPAGWLWILASCLALAQGPLTPPPGAPAPTMKTLAQIEPKTPISALPFTISQSGSYYLTNNLQFTAASGNAITITAGNVTLDLMGFTLSSAPAVSGDAITSTPVDGQLCVKNGNIVGNTTFAFGENDDPDVWTVSGFRIGVNAAGRCLINHLSVEGCREHGIQAGSGSVVEYGAVALNGDVGISADDSTISSCSALRNRGGGLAGERGSMTNCVVIGNGSHGISVGKGSVTNCSANSNSGNGIVAEKGRVSNCAVLNNHLNGIEAYRGSIANCAANGNAANGILAIEGTVVNCTARVNEQSGLVASGGSVNGCAANGNTGVGIDASSIEAGGELGEISPGSVANCIASGNPGGGIQAGSVSYCTAFDNDTINSGFGISAGTVTGSVARAHYFWGINAGSVSHSTAFENTIIGIVAAPHGIINSCTANNNLNHGIVAHGGSVTGCAAVSNETGISVMDGVISLSSASGNTGTQIYSPGTTVTGNNPP